jgi:hypothetical protein
MDSSHHEEADSSDSGRPEESSLPVTSVLALAESIISVRGERVMLDSVLAALYDVSAKRLNEAVRRNRARFPPDFMFQLTIQEMSY